MMIRRNGEDITDAYIDLLRERDEARAIARRLRESIGDEGSVAKIVAAKAAFDALPWAAGMKPNIPPDPHAGCERDLQQARAIARRYRNTHRDCAGHRGKRCATCVEFDALPWAKDEADG
jgi:hypothetical protein